MLATKPTVNVKERASGCIIEIQMPDGNAYRLQIYNGSGELTINAMDGGIMIQPKATNEIVIKTV